VPRRTRKKGRKRHWGGEAQISRGKQKGKKKKHSKKTISPSKENPADTGNRPEEPSLHERYRKKNGSGTSGPKDPGEERNSWVSGRWR